MSLARRVVVLSFAAGFVAFCVVQDRVTAGGVTRYVEMQRHALAGAAPPVNVDDVMAPAIRSSVRQGLLWGAGVAAVGLMAGVRRSPRG